MESDDEKISCIILYEAKKHPHMSGKRGAYAARICATTAQLADICAVPRWQEIIRKAYITDINTKKLALRDVAETTSDR